MMRRPVLLAAIWLQAGTLTACAPIDLDRYPWVDDAYTCVSIPLEGRDPALGGAFPHGRERPFLNAHVAVRTTDGRPIPHGAYVVVRFDTRHGQEEAAGPQSDLGICIGEDDVRWASRNSWTAAVRVGKDGPVVYRTPRPQVFDPNKPIVIFVEPVTS